MMKIGIWMTVVLCCALLWTEVGAALPRDLAEMLPEDAAALLEEAEEDGGVPSLAEGLARLWEKGLGTAEAIVRQSMGGAVLLLAAVLLCALAEDCAAAANNERVIRVAPAIGALVVTLTAAGDIRSLIGVGTQAMDELNVLSKALLPTLMAAVAAGGGAISAGVRHVAAVFFTDLLITLIRVFLLPLVHIYMVTAAGEILLPGRQLRRISKAIAAGTTWTLRAVLIGYTGYLTLAGAAATSADAMGVQVTQAAMGAVPVVGSIISDAAATVMSGAAVLKSTIGIVGTIAVLSLCLAPFLRLGIQYLLYKMTAFLAGTLGSESLVTLIDDLGRAFSLVLGMTGACATLLLISMMTSILAVSR